MENARQGVADRLVEELYLKGAVITPDRKNSCAFAYKIQFSFKDRVTVTIRLLLKDWQNNGDVVITHMTTLPRTEIQKGYGSQALSHVIDWAARNKLKEIRAAQVYIGAEPFWKKNGFVECPAPNPTRDFILSLSSRA